MSISPRRLPAAAAGAVLLLLAALPIPSARADATRNGEYVQLIFKDGFVLQGTVRREGKGEFDDGQVIFIPSGFFFIDDNARRQYFSPSLMQQPATEVKKPVDDVIAATNIPPRAAVSTETIWMDQILEVGPFDDDWNRMLKIRFGVKERTIQQRVLALTPYYANTVIKNHPWQCFYLTRELGPDVVKRLLSSNPALADSPQLTAEQRSQKRLRYADFMVQCGYDDDALNELARLDGEQPTDDVKKQAESMRTSIRQLQNRELFDAIKRMHNAGQYDGVRQKLAQFDDKTADADTLSKCNELREAYKTADKATADVTRFLTALPKDLGIDPKERALADASAALLAELQPDVLPKLDAFLGQARQAERQRAAGMAPAMSSAQLLSLAVTGWLGALPDPTPDRAARLWNARQFVQKYLAATGATRQNLLTAYEADTAGAATLDDVTRLIPLLPPPEPEPLDNLKGKVERTAGGDARTAAKYWLQLPPEYRHSRNYPVLIVLHQGDEDAEKMLDRWSAAAALNGYILVAPEWGKNPPSVYGYSEREHATVLDALRDLRRRFAVDSDRVFLFGLGWGGAMAFDVGLSHPDLFAGVMPMSAYPEAFSRRYARNAEYLPFYIVDGDRSGTDHVKAMRDQFGDWVGKYPIVWIEYRGRGVEWFGGEVPTMFDWMRGKKREFPLEQLGGSMNGDSSFATQRATDNSFYWLTTDDIEARCINSETNWKNAIPPATLKARINLEENTIYVDTSPSGVNQITLWLGANGAGVDMVRFDKPVTVRWSRKDNVWKNKVVTRSLATLLEDLARRGDRQRLFTAKLEFSAK